MPHYSFDVIVTLVKFGEKPVVMTRRTLDVYMSIVTEVAYNLCQGYINKGWRIQTITVGNFDFHNNLSEEWDYPS